MNLEDEFYEFGEEEKPYEVDYPIGSVAVIGFPKGFIA